ncbi:hydantoinase B/oxoprolinase family protein [Magnetococcus sp. PR-3]|uniref:hydantoinase B/oxoprolinase family protein n=1 Tax=Magnetococcus sp. PR-3 TaxID=3120355 RepID=UPI002FCE3775
MSTPKQADRHITQWKFAVDRGGTFTDVVGLAPDGHVRPVKLLSESPLYPDAAIEGIRLLLKLKAGEALPAHEIAWIRLGTTVATNALLERQGAEVGLLITEGFRDLLAIGDQRRSDLFALAIEQPEQVYQCVAQVSERMTAEGISQKAPDLTEVTKQLHRFKQQGITSVAVVLMHGWRNPAHEQQVAQWAQEMGFSQVTTSHQALSVIQMTGRGQTTLVDAYLSPVLLRYARRVQKHTGHIPLHFMSSAGSLLPPDHFTGKDAILSGPAGGVLGVATVAELKKEPQVIGFDMGGTSTDVCHYAGSLEKVLEVETAGIRYQTPMLHVETVAAGGGSVLHFDGRQLKVGPDSAGAMPGPACYGRGGPLAITDANVVLGRVHPQFMPKLFGPDGCAPLNVQAARQGFVRLMKEIQQAGGEVSSIEALALGFIQVANETMCQPVRRLAIAQGLDLKQHALVAFGGAGGQHACGVASALGLKRVHLHPLAGLLSAFGIAHTPHRRHHVESVLLPLNEVGLEQAMQRGQDVAEVLKEQLHKDPACGLGEVDVELVGAFRVVGGDATLMLPITSELGDMVQAFHQAFQGRFGFVQADVDLELVHLEVTVERPTRAPQLPVEKVDQAALTPIEQVSVWFDDKGPQTTPVYARDLLPIDQQVEGPALVVEANSVFILEPGFTMACDAQRVLSFQACGIAAQQPEHQRGRDPVTLALYNHRFQYIATRMGETLARTAHSVNIKERRDFSCAIFDGKGRLVANAPHVPVHLGAMGESIRHLTLGVGEGLEPGDIYASNDPMGGGSHLPDITVMAPLFLPGLQAPTFFVAARGHHADIGGIVPGSMPPFARLLAEEGVVLRHLLLVRAGVFDQEGVTQALTQSAYPARNLPERFADLQAQVAACVAGVESLQSLCTQFGVQHVCFYMDQMRENARFAMEQALEPFFKGAAAKHYAFQDTMDDGAVIAVRMDLFRQEGKPRARIDFTGTAGHHPGNLNAPPAVARAAVLYAMRLLIEEDIPLNDGCMEPIDLILPIGSMLNPNEDVAVSGGNVETSQRVVDVVLGALGVAAASQGTMNNVLFGRVDGQGGQYYETIAGGSGATAFKNGATGVQVHMTNTRITDPEVMEVRFPWVQVLGFQWRHGSGGQGAYCGGDGVIRGFRFLEPVTLSLVSERRLCAPFGLQGGADGKPGQQWVENRDGQRSHLPGRAQVVVQAGESVWIETPGGGGFGTR